MDGKFLYVMAHFDVATENKFKKLQSLLISNGFIGKQVSDFPHHVTLGSFEIDKEYDLVHKLKRICKITKKIPVAFNNIGLFGMKVLFISPSVSYELLDLHKEFDSDSANSFNWVPHVTILIDEQDNIQKALPIVSENFSTFNGYIESISIYEFYPSRFVLEEKLL